MSNDRINQYVDCLQTKAQNAEGLTRELSSVMSLLALLNIEISADDTKSIDDEMYDLLTSMDNVKDSMNKVIEDIQKHIKNKKTPTTMESNNT